MLGSRCCDKSGGTRLDDDAWPPDKGNDAAAAAANAVEDQVLGGDGPPKQRGGGFQVMFAKSMDELDTMQAQLRAGGGRRCPERYPYAYRPEQGFDYCCGTEDDNAGNLGINAGPMEDRSDSCKGHDFLECPMPPCADHAAGHPEIGGGVGDGDVARDGEVVGDDDPVMRQAKEQIKVRSRMANHHPIPHPHTLSLSSASWLHISQ